MLKLSISLLDQNKSNFNKHDYTGIKNLFYLTPK